MADDAVDHCSRDGWIAEDSSPSAEGQVAGEDQRRMLVAGRDELEEEIRGVLFEREVADLVDDDSAHSGVAGRARGRVPCVWGTQLL